MLEQPCRCGRTAIWFRPLMLHTAWHLLPHSANPTELYLTTNVSLSERGIGLNKQPGQRVISASVNVWLQSANWCWHWQLQTGGSFLQGLHSTGNRCCFWLLISLWSKCCLLNKPIKLSFHCAQTKWMLWIQPLKCKHLLLLLHHCELNITYGETTCGSETLSEAFLSMSLIHRASDHSLEIQMKMKMRCFSNQFSLNRQKTSLLL